MYVHGSDTGATVLPYPGSVNGPMADYGDHPHAPQGRYKPTGLTLIPWSEIRLSRAPRYLVKGVIPSEGLVVVYGPPKCGKTFWLFDALMHIVLGWDYRDRRTQQGGVVYCLFEGQLGFGARVEAFRMARMAEQAEEAGVPFHLMNERIALVHDHARLIATIRQQLGDERPAVIALDTLNRSFTGSEGSDEAMTAYVAAADAIRKAFGCAVVIVHHTGLEKGRPRGHTSLLGAADAQIGVIKDDAGIIIAKVEYMKDGPADTEIVSRLKVVDVGFDDDGEAITSCVVEPAEKAPTPAKGPDLKPNQKTMFGILHEAGPSGLSTEEWYARAREAGIGVIRKATLTDICMALKAKGLIIKGMNGWMVKHG